MIKINGHTISTIVVSTIMGHYGRGMFPYNIKSLSYRKAMRVIRETRTTIFSKSSTALKRTGNYNKWDPRTWDCVRDIPNMGMVNAYGLTNEGAEKCAIGIKSSIKKGFNVIPNYFPQFGDDDELTLQQARRAISIFASRLEKDFWAIEFNFSCPNDKRKIEENIAKAVHFVNRIRISFPWLTIIAKTSIVHPYEFLQELETAGADILHLVNSIPYGMIFDDESPVSKYGEGGVSGGPAFELALKYTSRVSKITRVPLIAGCGITDAEKFCRYREETRAESFSICTGLKYNTKEMIMLIRVYN
jgi:dihydroorotate dehydrogenase (NAD+) catalytic subunit